MADIPSDDLKTTPLHALHIELGGKMVDFAGWEMPVQYPLGIMGEHKQCREKAALFDVSHMGQVILRGENLSDVLRDVALQASRSVFDAALDPIADGIGSIASNALGSLFAAANGAVVAGGNVRPFARGGVVSGPTAFPLTGGMGLMGEAGPEAILPLSRGADGRLGVSAGAGGAPISVTVNVSTPDARSFQRSEAQIAGVMSRALARARRTQ